MLSTRITAFMLCCFAAAQGARQTDAADSLLYVTVVRVRGCHLTVYHHSASRSYHLAPAFCIMRDTTELLADATITRDNVIGGSYLSLLVMVTDSLLLDEARRSLAPLLQNRSLEFLQPLSAQASDGWSVPLVTLETGRTTGHLRLPCREANCHELLSHISYGRWYTIEGILVTSAVRIPGSQMIELQHRVSFAHRSRILLRQSSPNVIYGPRCSSLRLHETVKLSESCHATVLRSSYRRSHFVVEPVLCYEGRRSTHLGFKGGVVSLTLETKTEHVRDILRRKLPSALHIDFLSLVEAEVRVSPLLSDSWTFEPLRLEADGTKAELRVLCDSAASRERLISALDRSPRDLWRHVSFRAESQLTISGDSICTWQSPSLPFSATGTRNDVESELTSFHPIDGLLCIRPAFRRLLASMPDSMCAIMCNGESSCQAFSTAGGSCELFLFDKCSLNVRDCGCTRRGRVFVRRRAGLEPGQLCPSGFGHDLCGVKYKVTEERLDWPTAKIRSELHPGLVIMADVMDRVELQHIVSLYPNSMWVGGSQRPGSAEPSGGWHWIGCNRPVNMGSDLWVSGEPNNYLGGNVDGESVIEIGKNERKLNDMPIIHRGAALRSHAYISECLSPF